MTGMVLIFIAIFVLVLVAACALFVLRLLSPMELPASPPFPHRRAQVHRHLHPDAGPRPSVSAAETEDLAHRA